jgi:hypothetical protein
MTEEKALEAALGKRVRQVGGLSLKLWAVSFSGLPDRLVLLPGGRVLFVEVKGAKNSLSPRQLAVKKLLVNLGFTHYTLNSWALLDEIQKTHLK